jgi:aminomethyltransferase
MDPLMEFKPPFIDVTYHREEYVYKKKENGLLEKRSTRKRPGTVGICAAIQNHYKVDTVPHIICGGFNREETENALIDLQFLGIDNVLVSATGYTGAGGFEIYFENEHADKIWEAIFTAGAAYGIKPIGLGARDTLRLEMGFCLYGNDINDTTSPIEAGLGWITKFTKEFTNSKNLLAQKEAGVTKKLVGFELIDRGIPRHDYEICDAAGNNIGVVTSGTQSPTLQKGLGMGYVQTAHTKTGTEIFIKVRDRLLKAAIVKVPFLKK